MNPPRFAYATRGLAISARHLRDSRAQGDPAMVEAGRFTPAQAADRLRIASAIAAAWTAAADRVALPDRSTATEQERLATLTSAVAAAARRRDQAFASLGEWPWLHRMAIQELWALSDAGDALCHHINPYLHWESYTAALEALLWWQRRRMEPVPALAPIARAA